MQAIIYVTILRSDVLLNFSRLTWCLKVIPLIILTKKFFRFWFRCKSRVPGCFCLGFGRLVTHVWGHIRILQGCRDPSRKCCLVSDTWIPPRGVLGNVLPGTRAKQYKPTWWILSIACGKACRKQGVMTPITVKQRVQIYKWQHWILYICHCYLPHYI